MLKATLIQRMELPKEVKITYANTDSGYEQGSEYDRDHNEESTDVRQTELAIAMSPSRAREAAMTSLRSQIAAGIKVEFSTNLKYAEYEPADIWRVIAGGLNVRIRITGREDSQGVIRWEGETDKKSTYFQNAVSTGGLAAPIFGGGGVSSLSLALLTVFDLPRLDPSDPIPMAYGALQVLDGQFRGANIYIEKLDGSFREPIVAKRGSTMGVALTVLPAPSGAELDMTSTVDVELNRDQTLVSVTDAQLNAGANLAILDKEIFQFKTATLIGVDKYRLSGLRRGLKGTHGQADTHGRFDMFVLLSTVVRIPILATDVGVQRTAHTVVLGTSIEMATTTTFTVMDGGTLGPFTPDFEPRLFAGADELLEHETTDARILTMKGTGEPGDYVAVFINVADGEVARVTIGETGNWSYTHPFEIADGTYAAAYKYVRAKPSGPYLTAMSPTFEYVVAPVAAPAGEYKFYRLNVVSAQVSGAFVMVGEIRFYDNDNVRIETPYDMTKATADSHYVPANWNPISAFDNNPGSFWGTNTAFPHWLQWEFATDIGVARVEIAAAEYSDYAPKDFSIEGSSDGENWTTLADVTGAEITTPYQVLSVDL